MNEPLQVSRAVLGFPRKARLRSILAVVLVLAAVALIDPQWWGQVAVSAGRWLGRFWLVSLLLLAALALLLIGRTKPRPEMAVGRRPRAPRLPLLVHVALLLCTAAAASVIVGLVLWHLLGQQPRSPQTTLDTIKVVLTVVAGIGAVVALTVAYRKQRLGEVTAYIEDTKVLLDRYCKAAELLGSPDGSVRIAGIYAFAALANDAPEARQGCIDVLCAYLRQPYEHEQSGQEQQVRFTIIRLIRDNLHLPNDDLRSWRGHDFNFAGATFDGGDFTGATFTGAGVVSFANALIVGPLSFAGATFAGGIVSFDGARMTGGGSVSFSGARFRGGVVDLSGMSKGDVAAAADLGLDGRTAAGLRVPSWFAAGSGV